MRRESKVLRVSVAPAPWERDRAPAVVVSAAAPAGSMPDNTLLRERILASLRNGPLSTDEIRAKVDPTCKRGRATVYNAIYYLARLSQVRKIPAEGGRRDRWALTGVSHDL